MCLRYFRNNVEVFMSNFYKFIMLDSDKLISNLRKGFGIYGSVEELKKKLPKMSDAKLIDKLESMSIIQHYMDEKERISYYMLVVDSEDQAHKALKQDDEYVALLFAEADKRNL